MKKQAKKQDIQFIEKEKYNMKIYYIKTNGTEDNGFQPVICGYCYAQYKEVIQSLKERNISYITWCK